MKNLYLLSLFLLVISCGKKEEPATPPAVVTNIFVSKITLTAVILEWPAIKGAEGYRVYRINSLTTAFSVDVPLFEDTNLKNSTTYAYQVCAYNKYGEGPKSITITIVL